MSNLKSKNRLIEQSFLKRLNLDAIYNLLNDGINYDFYKSIGISAKSLADFNLIINQFFYNIAPKKVYVDNVKWKKIHWLDLDVKFIEKNKGNVYEKFVFNNELTYFKKEDKDVLILNCIGNNIYSSEKIISYFYTLFKWELLTTFTKDVHLFDTNFAFKDPHQLNYTIFKTFRDKLKQFKTILIVDEKTYDDIFKWNI